MKRKDTLLKGTIVLLADCNSHDAIIQGELAELLAPGVKAGNGLSLVEPFSSAGY